MSLIDTVKNNAVTIIAVVVVLAVINTLYQSCWSDKARIIRELEKMIELREKQIEELEKRFGDIAKREKQSLQKIAELKAKLKELQDLISESEVDLDEIKNQLPNIGEDLDFLDDYTRGTLDSLDYGMDSTAVRPGG